jgi:hypothetical protein
MAHFWRDSLRDAEAWQELLCLAIGSLSPADGHVFSSIVSNLKQSSHSIELNCFSTTIVLIMHHSHQIHRLRSTSSLACARDVMGAILRPYHGREAWTSKFESVFTRAAAISSSCNPKHRDLAQLGKISRTRGDQSMLQHGKVDCWFVRLRLWAGPGRLQSVARLAQSRV